MRLLPLVFPWLIKFFFHVLRSNTPPFNSPSPDIKTYELECFRCNKVQSDGMNR